MTDVLILLIGIAAPALIAFCLAKWRVDWGWRKILALSSLPVPALITIPSALAMISGFTTPPNNCGVDACGMAIAVGMMGLMAAALIAGVGSLTAWAGLALARNSGEPNPADTFE